MEKVKRRDLILQHALELFNSQGVGDISSRHISEVMGISYGNLTYHFPKKDDIIMALFHQMHQDLDEQFMNVQKEIHELDFMLKSLRQLLEVFHRYKFFFLGFAKLNRQLDELKGFAQQEFNERKILLRGIFNFLIEAGYMKPEKLEGHYDTFIHGLLLLFNSWIADAEFFYQGKEEDKIDYYLEILYSFMRPSLTKEGLKAFTEVYQRTV